MLSLATMKNFEENTRARIARQEDICEYLFLSKGPSAINKARFRALTATVDIGGEKLMLMKPQTYMNLSGRAVLAPLYTGDLSRGSVY